jgi:ferritin-like metal-binding protein YciE
MEKHSALSHPARNQSRDSGVESVKQRGDPYPASAAGHPTQAEEFPMALMTKDIESLADLFTHTLQDIYYAEKKIVKSLPKMIDKSRDSNLKKGLSEHLEQTREHVSRLEEVFEQIGAKAKAVDCPAIDGIIKEADELIGDTEDGDTLDAAIVAAAQAVEHYEMTRYGTLIAWAKQLGYDDSASVLAKTLAEEKAADKKLTSVAESRVNAAAA